VLSCHLESFILRIRRIIRHLFRWANWWLFSFSAHGFLLILILPILLPLIILISLLLICGGYTITLLSVHSITLLGIASLTLFGVAAVTLLGIAALTLLGVAALTLLRAATLSLLCAAALSLLRRCICPLLLHICFTPFLFVVFFNILCDGCGLLISLFGNLLFTGGSSHGFSFTLLWLAKISK
jgi:hypothetical protein